jgi:two-component system sensor histidine kinase PilS (NtrC family)
LNTDTKLFSKINASNDDEGWQILFYYNLYRLGLTVLLIGLASSVLKEITTLEASVTLLIPISGIALISLVTFVNIKRRKPALYIQAHILFIFDIVFITMLTLSQHLLDSSTLILYVTTAAATAVLFHLKVSLAYTTLCAALIFYTDYLDVIDGIVIIKNYYLSPLLVVGLYSVVVIVGTVANRSRNAQTVVEEQEKVLADLDQINQVVLDQLDLGVIFLDQKLNIILINQSASNLIGEFINDRNRLVGELSEVLTVYLKIPKSKGFNFRVNNKELGFSTLPLRNGYLVQIEDQTSIQKQIQQSKLASIGRMASAISHEIRNPLSAINHAAQLLMPQDTDNSEDGELIQIIRTHSKRIDEIIESVLSRSRPGKAQRKTLQLQPWLKVFIDTFHETVSPGDVTLSTAGGDGKVLFDPTQLEQIITNLCQNSIKYAKPEDGKLKIRFYVGAVWDGTPYLDITDNGQGVKPEDIDMLFEPFHTSDSKSTGLGLFLVKEFCNFNGAEIEYVKGVHRHGFRITFQQADSEDQQTTNSTAELSQQPAQEPKHA